MVAHPSHELRVHGWLQTSHARVVVLTDGSGRTALVGRADELGVVRLQARLERTGGLEELRRRVVLGERDRVARAAPRRDGIGGRRSRRCRAAGPHRLAVHDLPARRKLDVDLAGFDDVGGARLAPARGREGDHGERDGDDADW